MVLTLHTSLAILHLLGVVLGVGGATAADALILGRAIFSPVKQGLVDTVSYLSRLVTAGLLLLWVSGTALFFEIWQHTPAYHTNEKLWAKVAIVFILSINAFVIHGIVLPKLRQQVGRKLFSGLAFGGQLIFAASSAVSAVSWYLPLMLGLAKELSYVTPFSTIFLGYMWLVCATALAIVCIAIWTSGPNLSHAARMQARQGQPPERREASFGRHVGRSHRPPRGPTADQIPIVPGAARVRPSAKEERHHERASVHPIDC
jgi:hypothetical protein